ncbi:acylneuraminate cytidylyltransferase [Tenacibaculum todarodis]|uniref:Acylneuraminate cytidylyltransferase n=1 Tax=Tenacibaculum todarodis TaxID=1850252 RepID=A0A1L3JHT5_9FLAO|nr:acylneuraminate cytidylyltransferase family protein [Tenacibaculum todarodis]APG64700.1 acylneuraminate cytidylyltransferase [Tenacibaculum todarodis]
MKNAVIIPARGGSKRLPNKNIMLLEGVSLVAHSINFAKENSGLNLDIIVSTDHPEIKKIALEHNVTVVDRPKEISGDLTPSVAVMKHSIEVLGKKYDNVILLQPTNPLRPKNLLQDAFKIFTAGNFGSLMTVSKNKHKLGKIINNKFVPSTYKPGQRSQDLEPLFFENGLLYITKVEHILNDKIITEDAFPMEINHPFASIDIDTQEDFDFAEYLYNKHKNE